MFSRNVGDYHYDGCSKEVTPQRNQVVEVYLGLSITGDVVDVGLSSRGGVVRDIAWWKHKFYVALND